MNENVKIVMYLIITIITIYVGFEVIKKLIGVLW